MRRSKVYGFVTFVNRKTASMCTPFLLRSQIISFIDKTINMCTDGMFLIGPSWRPVRVEAAVLEEQEEGQQRKGKAAEVKKLHTVFKFNIK